MEKFIKTTFETDNMVLTLNEMDKLGYKLLVIVSQANAMTTAIFELI